MRSLSSWSVALILCACGPSGPGDTGATASTTSATSGEQPTSTGVTASTGDLLCEDPTVPVGPAVEVILRNTSADRLFVDFARDCHEVQPFTLAAGPGQPALKLDLGTFEFTCSEAQGGSSCGRDPGCPFGSRVLQIDPGIELTLPWSGGFFVPAELPEGCAEHFCGGCWIEQQAGAAFYTAGVLYGRTIMGCEGGCAGCEPNEHGWCVTQGVRLEQSSADAPFEYPGQTSVVLELL